MNRKIKDFLKFAIIIILALVVLVFLQTSKTNNEANTSQIAKSKAGTTELKSDYGRLVSIDQDETHPGFIIYPGVGDYKVRVLNMNGKEVHSWDVDAQRTRLLPDCSVLVVHGSKIGKDHPYWSKLTNTIRRYSWDGEVLWEYNSSQRIHHDLAITKDDTYMMPVKIELDSDLFRKFRKIPKNIKVIKSDEVVEIDSESKELWRWSAHEHLALNSCGRLECSEQHNQTGWTHMNTVNEIPDNKWYRQGDQRFRPGNVMIMLRNWWQALIIDKQSKEVVWEYGGDYRGGLSGGHEAHMIQEGLPGAGNILIFDNGRIHHQGEFIVLEINPITKEIVWKYEDGEKFFSHSAGSAQRLVNGNTLISQDASGRVLEVTPEGNIVWEFEGVRRAARAYKYDPDYCPEFSKLDLM